MSKFRAARPCYVVGQGAVEIRSLGRQPFRAAGFRAVPGCVVRPLGPISAPGVVLMPSSSISAPMSIRHHDRHLGHGRLLRPNRQELSYLGGAGIGGVLEPLQAGR